MSLNTPIRPPELAGIGTRSYSYGAATATDAGCQNVTVSGTSAKTQYPVNAVEVLLTCTTAFYFAAGEDPTAVAGQGPMIPANTPFHVQVRATDNIAAIQVSAGGTLTVAAVNQ